jgi:hypothetical protein
MYNDPTSNDPTEYHRQIEPMHATYRNPYETPGPYGGDVPPPPPPSPKQRHTGLIVASVSLLCLVMILAGVIVGIMLVSGQQKVTQVTPTPSRDQPTTPVLAVNYSAKDIYNDFAANGSSGTNSRDDTNWSCCTYTPEGGALVWTDNGSGFKLDIATFKSTSEAEVDARQLDSQNFSSTVVHRCLLSYDKIVPTSVISRYVQLMHMYCN